MPDIGTAAAKQAGQVLSASQAPVAPSEMPVRITRRGSTGKRLTASRTTAATRAGGQ